MTGAPSDDNATAVWRHRTAIAAVQNNYGVAVDERDWAALRECFTPDAKISFGRPARVGTLQEFIEWAPAFHDRLGPTVHQMTTHQATIRGASASARCYLHAVLVELNLEGALSVFGVYEDELVRNRQQWRICSRAFTPLWRHATVAPPALPAQ